MKVFNCIQGEPEWFAARLGIPTASCFEDVMAGGKGITRRKYMLKLVGEKLTGEVADGFSNQHTERGKALEPEARELYQLQTGNICETVGFIRADYDAGASPDSLIGNDGLLEIKTKLPHLQLEYLLSEKSPTEHMKQIQGQIMIAEREWCDFVSFWPGLPLFVKRVYRDQRMCDEIRFAINEFNIELNEIIEKIGRM